MKRSAVFIYGVLSYAFFFAAFLYSIGFIGNIAVPKSLDSAPTHGVAMSLLINAGLLALFAVQHSGMARPAFKRWLTRYLPAAAERSTYVLLSTVCLVVLMAFWAPLGGEIWNLAGSAAGTLMIVLYLSSWALLLFATFLIDHFDLFGLKQVWHALRGSEAKPQAFVTPALYRLIRHPIYTGWLGIMWFTPIMTISHLVFALGSTAYIFVGIKLEERDLEDLHPEYTQYKKKVPALLPSFSRRLSRSGNTQEAV